MLTFVFHFVLSCFIWEFYLSYLRPRYVTLGGASNHHIGEVQIRLMTLCHAYMCVTSLFLYILGIIPTYVLYWSRIHSTAFFVVDLVRSTMIRERLNELGEGKVLKTDPMVTFMHHMTTILLIHGAGFNGSHAGLVLFYFAEIPMIFLLTTWLHIYNHQEHTTECAIFRVLEIITYGAIRVLFVPVFFVLIMLPQLQPSLLSAILVVFYTIVYLQIVSSFVYISKLNWKPLKKFIKEKIPKAYLVSSLS